jgi:hypothetical protein
MMPWEALRGALPSGLRVALTPDIRVQNTEQVRAICAEIKDVRNLSSLF